VALYPRDGLTAPELIAAADAAMYVDKSGRDRTGAGPHASIDKNGDAKQPLPAAADDQDRPHS